MNATCNALMGALGWNCAPLAGHPSVQYINTPFTLKGGKPLSLYVEEKNGTYKLTDDGDTLWALRTVGHLLDDQRVWRGLRSLATSQGIDLSEKGAFETQATADELANVSARWMTLFSGILAWDAERLAIEDMDQGLDAEVERILSQHQNVKLDFAPRITVGSAEFEFTFRWGDMLIDAVPLHIGATNSRLRKALVVQRADDDQRLLFVVDDRKSVDRADSEVAVLSNVARAVALRNLGNVRP